MARERCWVSRKDQAAGGQRCHGALSVWAGMPPMPDGRAGMENAMVTPGLIVAPLTPFTADLKVDEGALQRQIDYVVRDCAATMVVAAGVETQEYTYLSLEQRK